MTTTNLVLDDTDARIQFTSVGEDEFDTDFPVLTASELKVSIDGAELTYGVDYTITAGLGEAGGVTANITDGTTAGQIITLWLDKPIERLTGFAGGAATLLAEDLNAEFVNFLRIAQQLRRDIRASIRAPVDDGVPLTDMQLPARALRARKFLAFDTDGDVELATSIGATALTSSLIGTTLASLLRTTAEIAASVVPVDYAFPPGDVRRYGAVLDGVTDDSDALLDAIKANNDVFVPSGSLLIADSTLTITSTYSKRRIVGVGRSSIILANDDDYHLITVQADDVTFENLAFHGVASAAAAYFAINTADTDPVVRMKVRGCYFGGASSSSRLNNGVKYDTDCDDGEVLGCFFDEMQGKDSGGGYNVLAGDVNNLRVEGNKFTGNIAGSRSRHAIYLSGGASYCKVVGNYTKDIYYDHITVGSLETQDPCSYNEVYDNLCVGGSLINVSGAISIFGKATGNKIRGNTIIDVEYSAIHIEPRFNTVTDNDLLDTEISDNYIDGPGWFGIDVWGSTRTTLKGNLVHNPSRATADTYSGIRLQASASSGQACTDARLVGNVVTGSGYNSALQLNSTTPTPVGTRLRSNAFTAGAFGEINDNSGAIEWEGTKGGTATIVSGTTSIAVTHKLGVTPTIAQLTLTQQENPTNDHGGLWVSGISSTQFTINCRSDPGASNLDVTWRYSPVE